jgi:hypothetical protein
MDSVRALILQWEVMTLVSDSQLGDRPNRRVAGGAQRKRDTQIEGVWDRLGTGVQLDW